MTREERDIAKRWCIFNCWGWPPDLPKPASNADRYEVATREMAKAVRLIGMKKCLEYWKSDEFAEFARTINGARRGFRRK